MNHSTMKSKYFAAPIISMLILCIVGPRIVSGQAINPMMYGMGMYMNPYYTGFYGGFGNMGHMNPLGYQISSGMAIPGSGAGSGQQSGYGGQGGGYGGYGAGNHHSPNHLVLLSALCMVSLMYFNRK